MLKHISMNLIWVVTATLIALSPLESAAEFFGPREVNLTLYGPANLPGGTPAKTYADQFNLIVSGTYYIDIVNGTPQEPCDALTLKCLIELIWKKPNTNQVDWAEIELNGRPVVTRRQMHKGVDHYVNLVSLTKGKNQIVARVQGKATEKITLSVHEVVFANPPTAKLKLASVAVGTAPFTALFDAGASKDPQGYPLTYSWNFGDGTSVTGGSLMPHEFLNPGHYTTRVTVRNLVGLADTAQAYVEVTSPPVVELPPVTSIPPLSSATPPSVADSVAFLYSGASPIQTGVESGAIDSMRIAVVRGRVLDENSQPLPGVQVSVQGSSNLGQTLSRTDGQFDLAINGGGTVVLNFKRNGYLSVQRNVSTTFQNYFPIADVTLTRPDPKVTVVTLNQSVAQLAPASSQTDGSGTRTAVVMIPSNTSAHFVLADGSTAPASQLSLRTTELTVGTNGESKMPGSLPPSSHYTYAFDISSDEGRALGAKHIQFSVPVAFYVDNFLGFPTGAILPFGLYNSDTGNWDPASNGRVITVLQVQNGSASLDILGSGRAATTAELTALKITAEELKQIALQYAAGKSFWRVQSDHFSAGDINLIAQDDQSLPPNGGNPNRQEDPDPNACVICPCPKTQGSIINVMSQTLGEVIPITATPITLNYTTKRSLGRAAERTLWVPLTAANVNPALSGVTFAVDIAGRTFSQDFQPTPSLLQTFTWDGKDAYGRSQTSALLATVHVQYKFPATYRTALASIRPFSAPLFSQYDANLNDLSVIARSPSVVEAQFQVPLGAQSAQSEVGGWLINVHHVYDPVTKRLYFGDGSVGREQPSILRIQDLLGNGNMATTGDGGPAVTAQTSKPTAAFTASDGTIYFYEAGTGLIRKIDRTSVVRAVTSAASGNQPAFAEGPDHSIYFSDSGHHQIRKISPSGNVSVVAGTGTAGYSGDGGQALSATLSKPSGLAFSGGSLYFTDSGNHTIRGISTQGIISTFIGNGTAGVLNGPTGLAISPSGDFYVADTLNNVVKKISATGSITIVAGTGAAGFAGDNGPATSAQLSSPTGLALKSDNSLVIADTNNNRIRQVNQDGLITTIVGNGQVIYPTDFQGDGGAATSASLDAPAGLALAQDGSFVFADSLNNRVRKISAVLPGLSTQNLNIPSDDSSEIYVFAPSGQHLKTLYALTGAAKWTFGYDANGLLISIADGNQNITQIQRDSSGNPTAIVSPYGQVTNLALDSNGNLASVRDPAGQTYRLAYDGSGLLSSFTKPNGNTSTFEYDTLGNLVRDTNAAGGYTALTSLLQPTGLQVNLSTAMGRQGSYSHQISVEGQESAQYADTGGLANTSSTFYGVGQGASNLGETNSTQLSTDQRLGLPAKFFYSQSTQYGSSGPSSSVIDSRGYTPSISSDPFAFRTDDFVTVNGNTWHVVYDGSTRTFTTTSPLGGISTTTVDSQGRPTQTQTANLTPVSFAYDSRGNLTQTARGARVTSFAYDSQGNLTSVTNPLNQSTAFAYDSVGRTTALSFPDGRQVGFNYDANGNLTSITPPGRQAYSFLFSPLDLVTSFLEPSLGTSPTVTQYTYNADRQLASLTRPDGTAQVFNYDTATNRLLSITMSNGTTNFSYNAQGLKSSSSSAYGVNKTYSYQGSLETGETFSGAANFSTSRTYNADLKLASETVGGSAISYSYGQDGLLSGAGPVQLTRDPQTGLITSTTVGTITDQYTYNSFGEVMSYTAGTYFAQSFTRDALGRITLKTETVQGVTNVYGYTYDVAGRLIATSLNGVPQNTYTYDSNGNRISATIRGQTFTATYDAQDRILTYGQNTYTYDLNGQLITKTTPTNTVTYLYTPTGKAAGWRDSFGHNYSNFLDADDLRVAYYRNGQPFEQYVHDLTGRTIAILGPTGSVIERWVYASKSNIPDVMFTPTQTYRIISDHLGSPRVVVNVSTGAVVQVMQFDEFGQVLVNTNPGATPFGFAGALYASNAPGGILSFLNRNYDPETGRWKRQDPIGFAGGDTNLYGYVLNDPVNRIDPKGTGPIYGAVVCAALGGAATFHNLSSALKQYGTLLGDYNKNKANIENDSKADECEKNIALNNLDNQFQQDVLSLVQSTLRPNANVIIPVAAACLAALAAPGP